MALLIVVPILIAVAEVLIAFANGIKIWQGSNNQVGPRRVTMRLSALNLCEPLVNVVLVFLLLRFFTSGRFSDSDFMWFSFKGGLLVTAPVAVLLLPLGWIFSADPLSRSVNARLAVLGAARWGVTALTFVQPLVMVLGLIVLGFSIRWVRNQAFAVILPAYRAIGVGPEGVMVGDLSDFKSPPGLRH